MQTPLRWQLFDEAQRHLTAKGSEVATGTIVAHRHRAVVDEVERAKNRTKPKVRASSLPSRKRGVEHSFGVIKRVFGFAKVRYRGLKKNTHRPARNLRADQSVHSAPVSAALPTGQVCPQPGRQTVQTPQCDTKTAHPVPSLSAEIAMPLIHPPAPCPDVP